MASLPPERSGDEPVTAPESILVVDDNEAIRRMLVRSLSRAEGREVTAVGSSREARAALSAGRLDVVITDLAMPGEDGLQLMTWAQEQERARESEAEPGPVWIVLTGHGTMEAAVQALQLGAFDFIAKPLSGIEPLRKSVQNAIDHRRLRIERDGLTQALAKSNAQLREHVEQLEDACGLLQAQSESLQADLRRAALIQQALLPQEPPELPGWRVEALYRPSESVGGDLYDVVPLDDRHLAVLVGDAAGHGLAAAMLAVLFHTRLRLRDGEGRARPPAEALRLVNRALCGFAPGGLFLTAACAVLETRSGALSVASAGHTPLLLQRADGEVERLYHTGPALGLHPEALFGQRELQLRHGDRLWMHTDGLYECLERASGSELPVEAVVARLDSARPAGPGAARRAFGGVFPEADTAHEAGDRPGLQDDVTLLLLAAEDGPSELDNGEPPPLATSGAPPQREAELLVGANGRGAALCVRGRADWACSAAFHARCLAEIEAAHPVLVDLSLCAQMDSTFLGTLHELSRRADETGAELRLQGVLPAVQALFDELGMNRVLERVVSTMLPLPGALEPLLDGEGDAHQRALRVLRAHESLAGLSEANRREFDPLLEVLRKEVEATRPAPRKVAPDVAERSRA